MIRRQVLMKLAKEQARWFTIYELSKDLDLRPQTIKEVLDKFLLHGLVVESRGKYGITELGLSLSQLVNLEEEFTNMNIRYSEFIERSQHLEREFELKTGRRPPKKFAQLAEELGLIVRKRGWIGIITPGCKGTEPIITVNISFCPQCGSTLLPDPHSLYVQCERCRGIFRVVNGVITEEKIIDITGIIMPTVVGVGENFNIICELKLKVTPLSIFIGVTDGRGGWASSYQREIFETSNYHVAMLPLCAKIAGKLRLYLYAYVLNQAKKEYILECSTALPLVDVLEVNKESFSQLCLPSLTELNELLARRKDLAFGYPLSLLNLPAIMEATSYHRALQSAREVLTTTNLEII